MHENMHFVCKELNGITNKFSNAFQHVLMWFDCYYICRDHLTKWTPEQARYMIEGKLSMCLRSLDVAY